MCICQQIEKDDVVECNEKSDDLETCDDVYNDVSVMQQVKCVCFGCLYPWPTSLFACCIEHYLGSNCCIAGLTTHSV